MSQDQPKRYLWTYAGHSFYASFNSRPYYKTDHIELADVPTGRIWPMFDRELIKQVRQEAEEIA